MSDFSKTPFVRELASSDKKIRDKATESLALFLRSRTDLSLLELLKLWKGLFFCFYHSDRPLTQQALARNLSYGLIPTLPRATLLKFLQAFWITIGREWHSLDRLRLDKYLLLIRSYVGVSFQILLKGNTPTKPTTKKRKINESAKSKKRSKSSKRAQVESPASDSELEETSSTTNSDTWSDLQSYMNLLSSGPLSPITFDPSQPALDEKNSIIPMPLGPDGLRYHLLDIWFDELEKALEIDSETGKPVGEVPIEILLAPVEKLRKEGLHKPVRVRAAETLDDERLVEWGFRKAKKVEESEEEESDEEWGGFGDD
ncbi:nucleolar protein,Nop52-domain-containing protein [Aspergillus californicus]